MVVSPDRTKVVVGGNFTTVNGATNAGWASINASTSAVEPWAVNSFINNSGTGAAITGLTSDADYVYASGYDFNGVGTAFEGVVARRWSDGAVNWLEDCHGDTYSVWSTQDVVYSAGHAHYCGNVQGFPETNPRSYNHALAFGKTPVATITRDTQGYRNFEGNQHSALLNWWPTFTVGSFTGQYQATWSVTGNSEYVVMGGEFPTVSGVRQQGLVRFGIGTKSTNNKAPEKAGKAANPAVISVKDGEARITWASNWDRDNKKLTYRVYRDGNLTAPIHETTGESTFWQMPTLSYIDKGLAPGSKHTYRIFALDAYGNEARSESVEVTIAAAGSVSPYATSVLDDGASSYWRLGEASGTNVVDWAGFNDLTAAAGVTRGEAGAIAQDADKASTFNGTDTGAAARTHTTGGTEHLHVGGLGQDDHDVRWQDPRLRRIPDRELRLLRSSDIHGQRGAHLVRRLPEHRPYPQLVKELQRRTVASRGVVARSGRNGAVHRRSPHRQARGHHEGPGLPGVWRVGGDNLGGWPNQPASYYFNGVIDDVAIYPTELTRAQIQAHYSNSGREVAGPKKPADAYGAAVYSAEPELYWRLNEADGSTAADASQAGVPGTYVSGITLGKAGALKDVSDGAAEFNGSSGLLSSTKRYDNPSVYSQELWFNTTTANGGKLIGFGDNPNGLSGNYDRHVYMENDGRLTFGVWTGRTNLAQSTDAYNDGKWHHMVATQSGDGMVLYVDGKAVGTNPQTSAQGYSGHWKIGSDNTWGPQPFFAGTIDEVAVYSRALGATEVADHYRLGGGTTTVPNKAPVGWRVGDGDGSDGCR